MSYTITELLGTLLFLGFLAWGCIMDIRTTYVYNFVWWGCGAAAVFLYLFRRCDSTNPRELPYSLLGIAVYLCVQLILFSRFYGKADCYAFVVCSVLLASLGYSLREYFLHMLLAWGLLAMHQLLLGNVKNDGNLKKPVPFIPYIALALCGMLWYHYIC